MSAIPSLTNNDFTIASNGMVKFREKKEPGSAKARIEKMVQQFKTVASNQALNEPTVRNLRQLAIHVLQYAGQEKVALSKEELAPLQSLITAGKTAIKAHAKFAEAHPQLPKEIAHTIVPVETRAHIAKEIAAINIAFVHKKISASVALNQLNALIKKSPPELFQLSPHAPAGQKLGLDSDVVVSKMKAMGEKLELYISNQRQLMKYPLSFQKNCPTAEAEKLLKGQPEGTWLLRWSKSSDAMVVSFIEDKNVVHKEVGSVQDMLHDFSFAKNISPINEHNFSFAKNISPRKEAAKKAPTPAPAPAPTPVAAATHTFHTKEQLAAQFTELQKLPFDDAATRRQWKD
ncbi:MAG TPA: SH2 domain-containing protein, partial [Chlamydiales bacterium]|nr:SH2 domain-containing protein [Chlamydiales bacterium]